ncbi:MAG TPA: hypothetical protein VJS92_11740 [Candidatus Polarisedimenticolaceae bacterium]|nr:hypothetical protein [Candidatus Polarisedimenticolaceae bacterium]
MRGRGTMIVALGLGSALAAGAAEEPPATGLGPSASRIYGTERGVAIGGYGEWLYQRFDDRLDDGSPSAAQDSADALRLVLYAGYKFDERFLLNSEIEFEHGTTDDAGEVSVEFAYLDYFYRPELNVRTGLMLMPVGWINEIHEPPSFLGARRPDVEHDLLPSTWQELGAGVFGDVGPFAYRAYLTTSLDGAGFSAGEGIREGRQHGSEAVAEDLALSGRLDYTGVTGLRVGASAFHGDSGQGQSFGGEEIDGTVRTLDLHAEWRWRALELRGLWVRIDVDDADLLSGLTGETIGARQQGGYFQAGYDVLASTRFHRSQLIPFARLERLDTQDRVPAALAGSVTGENDRRVTTVGVVFKPRTQLAFKADFQNFHNEAGTGQDQFNVAVGFAF